jgi:[ribosomal protein S18]-alanine N-acetyltransferase
MPSCLHQRTFVPVARDGSGVHDRDMSDRTRVVSLPDGRALTVRPAIPADVDGLVALYDSLSVEDRRRRFFTASHPPRKLLERFVEATDRNGLWFVAVTEDGEIVADGGYTMRPDGDGEFALTVGKAWRGWLGSYLLDAVLSDAAEHGVRNLRADIMLENRPMLRLAERRGYATVDEPDWMIVNVVISTEGGRPGWPPVHDRPRLLVEGCGARWHADTEAWAAGWDVVTCAGPGARSVATCPLLDGEPCPLVEGADLVVVALRPSDPRHAAVLDGHASAGSTPPVLDEATMSPDALSRWLVEAPARVARTQDQEIHHEHPRCHAPA